MLTSEMFRSPRSTLLTYVRCSPASSASFSWEMLRFWRTSRNRRPNLPATSLKADPSGALKLANSP